MHLQRSVGPRYPPRTNLQNRGITVPRSSVATRLLCQNRGRHRRPDFEFEAISPRPC